MQELTHVILYLAIIRRYPPFSFSFKLRGVKSISLLACMTDTLFESRDWSVGNERSRAMRSWRKRLQSGREHFTLSLSPPCPPFLFPRSLRISAVVDQYYGLLMSLSLGSGLFRNQGVSSYPYLLLKHHDDAKLVYISHRPWGTTMTSCL